MGRLIGLQRGCYLTLPELVDTCEKLVLRNSIETLHTTSTDLARRLGLSRRTLYNKIHKYDLPAPRRGAPSPASSQTGTSGEE